MMKVNKVDEFRTKMAELRTAANDRANLLKDSYAALEVLFVAYKKLDKADRVIANQVLREWLLSDDENVRFDAIALVVQFNIADALPDLQKLARRLASSDSVSAPFELEKVDRIIGELSLI